MVMKGWRHEELGHVRLLPTNCDCLIVGQDNSSIHAFLLNYSAIAYVTHTHTTTGSIARVNWIACDDVGAVGAALLLRGLLWPPADASTSAVKAVFEVGV